MNPIFISQNFKKMSKKEKLTFIRNAALYVFGAGFIFVVGIFIFFSKDMPSPTSIKTRTVVESTKIYDKTGEHLLYDVHGEEKRTIIPFEQIPETVKYAAIALEDQEFYSHHGIKITSMIRSALKDIIKGSAAQGGSTITQQFVKKALLTDEKTFTRKIKEIILSIEIETKYSKDEILGMYLNQIPYGSSAYGIEAAAQTFFSKSARDLNLSEAALLASLPNAPTYYSPFGLHADELKMRQEITLQKMVDQGYITQDQANEAKNVDVLSEISPKQDNISAPHFVMYVKDYLVNKYGEQVVEQGGLKVYTTLDWNMQQIAETAVAEGAAKNSANKASNAALVAEDPKTGQILAMVGSKNYFGKSEPAGCISGKTCTFEPQDNVAIRNRQPGSSFKPYVYLTAFTKGYTPETLIYDVETSFTANDSSQENYKPQNYDGKFHGPLQMKNTLAMSLNIPAVKTLYLAGVKNSIQVAKSLGITGLNQPERYGLSLVLGGGEVKLMDHVNAYGSLARGGVYKSQTFIARVEDKSGSILEEYKSSDGQRIVEEKYVGALDYIMSTNDLRAPIFGENNPFKFDNRPVAAKTGTTNEFRDGWAVGYTPSIVAGVWAGNNDNSPMKAGADGIVVAAPIWRNFMDKVLVNYPIEQFPKYEKEDAGKPVLNGDIGKQDNVKVCEIPGEKNEYCLASDACPDSLVEKKDFTDIHTILYYVNKDDPRGDSPKDPKDDPQFKNWEKGVLDWAKKNSGKKDNNNPAPTEECTKDDFSKLRPDISVSVENNSGVLSISAEIDSPFDIDKVTFLVEGKEAGSMGSKPFSTTYDALGHGYIVGDKVTIEAEIRDSEGNTARDSTSVTL